MQALVGGGSPPMLIEGPVVQEWDDGSCLAIVVERLARVHRQLDQVTCVRRFVALATLAILIEVTSVAVLACSAAADSLLAGLGAAGMVLLVRTWIFSELDGEADRLRVRADAWTRDVQRRLARTDWLIEP